MNSPNQLLKPNLAYQLALGRLLVDTGESLDVLSDMAYDLLFEKFYGGGKSSYIPSVVQPLITQTHSLHQLDVIPIDGQYSLLLLKDHKYSLGKQSYPSLAKALDSARALGKDADIGSEKWVPIEGEYPLVFLKKKGGLPHLWLGQNSVCKIFNSKEIKINGFKLTTQYPIQNICKTCLRKFEDLSASKVSLALDNEGRLLPPDIQDFDTLF